METLRNDIKHAWRMFRENKLFTATAVAALTLGIGVNIAIFSVVNAVLLKPVPFPEPDTLVQMVNANNGVAGGPASSPAKYMHWRAQTDVLESVAAGRNIELNLEQGDVPESIRAAQTTRGVLRRVPAPARHGPLVHGRRGPAERGLHRRAELQLLDAAHGERSRRHRQEHHVVRQSVHDRRRRRPRVRRPRFRRRRPRSGCRSSSIRTRRIKATIFTNVGAPQARRLARAGASAARWRRRRPIATVTRWLRCRRPRGFSAITLQEVARAPGAADAARRARRRRLRAADRVRERREPAADPRDGAAPRAGRARRARRRALAHHAPAV